jgi:hypothetical protein
MSVIGPWTLTMAESDGAATSVQGWRPQNYGPDGPEPVREVEVVSADQLGGAVSALDALRRAADAFDATLSSTVDGPERDAMRAASVAASRIGGE